MTRRDFFARLVGAGVAVVAAPLLPSASALQFHKDAFSLVIREFAVGDVITMAGYFARNPTTGQETEHLQRFLITAVDAHGISMHPHWRLDLEHFEIIRGRS